MRNQEIARGLRLIAEGFTTLAVAYEQAPVVTGVDLASTGEDITTKSTVVPMTKEVVQQEVTKPVKEEPKVEEKEEVIAEVNTGEIITEASLNALSYNDLKAKAKELGVKAVGSKAVIISNILASLNTEEVPLDETFTEEEVDKSLEEVQEEPNGEEVDVEDEDEEELEDTKDSLYDQVVADLEGYTDEELADILSDIGISPKGRRQALLAKIVQAIEDGKLEWEDEESGDTPQEATTPSKDVEPQDNEEDVEDDFVGTEARKQACWDECEALETSFDKGEISHKEVMKYLKDYYNGKYVSQGEEADIEEYIAIQCDLIDDEGEKHEMSDPYYVGDDVFCCGAKLKELNGDLYCEHCGVTYENE